MNTTETTKKLPDTPSALIRVALQDLEACEKDPNYLIHMSQWHDPNWQGGQTCLVCFAGATMAKTLGAPVDEYCSPQYFDRCEQDKLLALDMFRRGEVAMALKRMDKTLPTGWAPVRAVVSYEVSPGVFKKQMYSLADDFEAEGL